MTELAVGKVYRRNESYRLDTQPSHIEWLVRITEITSTKVGFVFIEQFDRAAKSPEVFISKKHFLERYDEVE